MIRRGWIVLGLLAAGCGGSGPPTVTNTGYVGTWERGGVVKSTLAIAAAGDDYLVRWTLIEQNGAREVRCEWDGVCQEFAEGNLVSDFVLTPSLHAESGYLRVECRGTAYGPEGDVEMHFLDELVVRPRGKKLVARTLEQSGQTFERGAQPRRVFEKVSDAVDDPPATTNR